MKPLPSDAGAARCNGFRTMALRSTKERIELTVKPNHRLIRSSGFFFRPRKNNAEWGAHLAAQWTSPPTDYPCIQMSGLWFCSCLLPPPDVKKREQVIEEPKPRPSWQSFRGGNVARPPPPPFSPCAEGRE